MDLFIFLMVTTVGLPELLDKRLIMPFSVTNNTNDSYDISDLLIPPHKLKECLVTPFYIIGSPPFSTTSFNDSFSHFLFL